MKKTFISLCPNHPEGFEYKEPTRRDLLSGEIAIYTDSLETAFSLLDNFCQRVHGLIVTEGVSFQQTVIGPQLWHLQIAKGSATPLDLISVCFNLISFNQSILEEDHRLRIELARSQRDHLQIKKGYDDYSKYLGKKIEELRDEVEKRREAEEQLSIFKMFAEASSQGIGWIDLDGNLVYVNKTLSELFGEPNQQAALKNNVGQTYYSPSEQLLLKNHILPSLMNGKPWSGELSLQNKQGEFILTHNHLFLIKDSRGKPAYMGNIINDIREEKKTEEELIKIKKLESVGVLAGGIAHDFNNLLSAILGNINLSLTETDPDSEVYQLLDQAQKASIRAKSLTQQLLTFSKGGSPVKQTVSIGKTITDSADFVLHGSPVACTYIIPEDLWAVDIDVGQMGQVIQNLVINATQAMPSGGLIKITCKNSENKTPLTEGKQIIITITDQGCGIPEDQLGQVFDPYFSTKETGSGLGLSICHSIVIKHGGTISVQSEGNEGTTFTIGLPASTKLKKTEEGSVSEPTEKTPTFRCLLMDDEPMTQMIVERMLIRLGHTVVSVNHGEEAINAYREEFNQGTPFDICIMDLTIKGGMGGEKAVLEILKIDPKATAIVASGYSGDPIMADYSNHGFKASLSKPFMMAELKSTLSQFRNLKPTNKNPLGETP